MKKRKISVTTGTRADYGFIRPILYEIAKRSKLELCLIVVGMHLSRKYGMTINEIRKDGFSISATIDTTPKGNTNYYMSKSLGEGIISFSNIFKKFRPDINLILGDRDEMFASAISAYHMNIPNAHIQGGDKSGGLDEYNRHAITKISNIHFPATKKSKERIIRMGENPKYVFLTGSTSVDEIIQKNISTKDEIQKKYGINFTGKEILLIQHPVTTETKKSEEQILNILNAILKIGYTTIAIAPNSDAGNKNIFHHLKTFSLKHKFLKMYDSLPRRDYLCMLQNCGVLVGNSSSGLIEAGYFRTPVVNIGIRQHERERENNVIDVINVKSSLIYYAIKKSLNSKKSKIYFKKIYGNGTASKKIVDCLENIVIDDTITKKQIFY